MSKKIEMIGKKFGNLTVIEEHSSRKNNTIYWICKCDCGKVTNPIKGTSLRSRSTKSCGCLSVKIVTDRNYSHGLCSTRIYSVWANMKRRCCNPNANGFENYGGRGITVCEQWYEFLPFYEWAISNGYRDDLTIDRIDVNGNYCPENCRWVDVKTQQNNRRNNVTRKAEGAK